MYKKIKIISVGKVKEKYIIDGINEYKKKLKHFCTLEQVYLKEETLEKEEKKILPYLTENTFVLDSNGMEVDSIKFAGLLKDKTSNIIFIIGGSDGFTKNIKNKANLLSLSQMTFLHEMTNLILLEQIYRSFMINSNRKYHK